MKIAQVVCSFPPYKGGMGNVALHYSLELAKLGHKITVVVPHYKEREMPYMNFQLKSFVPWLSHGQAAYLPQLLWQLRHFDIIHLHCPFFGTAWPLYWLKKLRPKNTKLVLTYHMDVVGQGLLARYFYWHGRYLLPQIIKVADKVIVTSSDYIQSSNIKELANKYPDKFIEIPLGVDLKQFKPAAKDKNLLEKYQITTEQKVILFVAALDSAHYFKGLSFLLEVLSQIKDQNIKLLVVGRGNLKKDYEQLAVDFNIRDQVNFVGYVNDEDLVKHYNLSDLFVLPSIDKSEAFGLVLVEAMACGKPVIASNLAGVRSVVDDGVNGLLTEPQNVEDLKEKIMKILDNPELADRFGQAGLAKVKERYNWQSIAKRIDEVYRHL
ncbi:MAG: glycosyltransferase family 4 protein [Patescibacteria group bacterium]